MNYYMQKADYDYPIKIKIGIGMSWGRAPMIKAGHNGSGINDVAYMGDVVNKAAKLANYGSSQSNIPPIVLSEDFHFNLNKNKQSFFRYDRNRKCYIGYVLDSAMDDWYENNCT
ncbi:MULTISPECIES: hypothetical protein [Streptomyces albidoflavus group]|nr:MULTISPECIES: hypothetical protein [Streptomyces albidoflavus group]